MSIDPAASLFHMNEGALPINVPGVWEDRTMHVLRLPGHGHAVASLVITREDLPLGMEVADYIRSEVTRMHGSLPEFVLMGRVGIAWTDGPGEATMMRWRSTEGLMDQIIACRRSHGRKLLIFTATHPTPMPSATHEGFMAAITGFTPRTLTDPTPIAG